MEIYVIKFEDGTYYNATSFGGKCTSNIDYAWATINESEAQQKAAEVGGEVLITH